MRQTDIQESDELYGVVVTYSQQWFPWRTRACEPNEVQKESVKTTQNPIRNVLLGSLNEKQNTWEEKDHL